MALIPSGIGWTAELSVGHHAPVPHAVISQTPVSWGGVGEDDLAIQPLDPSSTQLLLFPHVDGDSN